jgi:FAD/FMN-containing dehydrogenase
MPGNSVGLRGARRMLSPRPFAPARLERTEEFGAEIGKLCIDVGGVLSGEHGIGVEKRN